MKYFITGGAGFIGSNLVDRLLTDNLSFSYSEPNEVVVYDNFSTGRLEFLEEEWHNPNLKIVSGDILNQEKLKESMKDCDFVFHFAANADVRHGIEHTYKDLEQNTIGTYNVLEAMRYNNIKKIAFSSTGSVYGESPVIPTPEDAPFPIQTSLYGASKVAGEALIQAYVEGFSIQAWIFRFVSILGENYQHGHLIDFYYQLKKYPEHLDVLGDGSQTKSYLYVQDCIDGIFCALKNSNEKINIFNLGTNETITINKSIKIICDYLTISPKINYSGGKRGWIGDSPMILLDTRKINNLGWKPKLTIQEGIIKTLKYLNNKKIYEN